jgi:hypothetical protein
MALARGAGQAVRRPHSGDACPDHGNAFHARSCVSQVARPAQPPALNSARPAEGVHLKKYQ